MSRTRLLLCACCAAALAAPAPPPEVVQAAALPSGDYTKKAIEDPTKHLVAETAPAPRPALIDADNSWVEPGRVKWHKSFAEARAAAENSGKPVLLFQMMGRLDQQFT